MATEKIRLSMDTRHDKDGTWEYVVDRRFYMPDDHRYMIDFMIADLNCIMHLINGAIENLNQTSLEQADEYLEKVHPYFAGAGNKDRRRSYIYGTAALLAWRNEATAITSLTALGIEDACYIDKERWANAANVSQNGTIISLSECQQRTKRKVVLILDDSNPEFSQVPMSVRGGLYGLVDGKRSGKPAIAEATARYILPASTSMRTLDAVLDFDDDLAMSFYQTIDDYVNTGTLSDKLKTVIQKAQESVTEEGYTEYTAEYLEQIIDLEIFLMLRDGVRLHKCKACGRYFPAENNYTLCNITGPDGSSCRSREAKIELEQAVKKIYTTAYKTHYARIQAGKETKDYVDSWRTYAAALQEQVYQRHLTPEEYKAKLME